MKSNELEKLREEITALEWKLQAHDAPHSKRRLRFARRRLDYYETTGDVSFFDAATNAYYEILRAIES